MSITKKHDKSANTISGGRYPKPPVAPHKIHCNPRVRTVIEFMTANLERRISLWRRRQAKPISPPPKQAGRQEITSLLHP